MSYERSLGYYIKRVSDDFDLFFEYLDLCNHYSGDSAEDNSVQFCRLPVCDMKTAD